MTKIIKKTIYNEEEQYQEKYGATIFGPNENRKYAQNSLIQSEMSGNTSSVAYTIAENARQIAVAADDIANATNQHFWTDDNGVHVSSQAEEPDGDKNTIWNANGMLFRNETNNLLALVTGDSPGVAIFDGDGNTDANIVASFGRRAVIGKIGDSQLILENDSITGNGEDGKCFFSFNGNGGNDTVNHSVGVYSGLIGDFPRQDNALSVSLPNSILDYLRLDIRIEYNGYVNSSIDFTVGTAETKTKTITIAGSNVTFSAAYNGSNAISNIKITSVAEALYGYVMYLHCDYSNTETAPTYVLGNGTATGSYSIAEGLATTASGPRSHAFGLRTTASGGNSVAMGYSTIASSANQLAIGKWNKAEAYPFIIGNGTGDDEQYRLNILTVDWDGNTKASGTYTDGTGYELFPFYVATDNVNISALDAAGGTYDNRSGNQSVNSKDMCIVGWELAGTRATFVSINKLCISSGKVYWQVRNFATNATGALTLTIHTLRKR